MVKASSVIEASFEHLKQFCLFLKGEENHYAVYGKMSSSKLKKPRKARTAFTDQQLNNLEKHFARQKYLSVQDRMELATKLGLSDTQVKTWYQNRR